MRQKRAEDAFFIDCRLFCATDPIGRRPSSPAFDARASRTPVPATDGDIFHYFRQIRRVTSVFLFKQPDVGISWLNVRCPRLERMSLDDSRLVQLIGDGDESAVAEVLQHHGGRVTGYLRSRFPSFDDQDRHDVLVDSVMQLVRTFDPARGALGPWLLLLAHQAAVDLLRRGVVSQSTIPLVGDYDVFDRGPTPDTQLLQGEQLQQIRQAMDGLSRLERAVIEADLDVGDTADAATLARQLQTTEGSIYAARQRAKETGQTIES